MEMYSQILFLTLCMIFAKGEILSYGDGSVHAGFTVRCSDQSITVAFNKTELDSRTRPDGSNNRTYRIAWKGHENDLNCVLNATNIASAVDSGNNEDLLISANYPNECGLTEEYNNQYIFYNQTIVVTYGNNPNNFIIREEYDYYDVACLRNRTIEQTFGTYNVSSRTSGYSIKNATSDYTFTFNTYTATSQLGQYEYKLGEYITFDISFGTSGNRVKAVVQKCWSTSDGSNNAYYLIDNRCLRDAGSKDLVTTSKSTQWKTEAYRYLSPSSSAVYVECLIKVCLITAPSSDCTYCSSRKRRDVKSGESSVNELTLVRSPVFYIIDKDVNTPHQSNNSPSIFSGTNGAIIIGLLATLVFLLAVIVTKQIFLPLKFSVPTGKTTTTEGVDNTGFSA